MREITAGISPAIPGVQWHRVELPAYTSGHGGTQAILARMQELNRMYRNVVLEAAIQQGGWEPTP